MKRNPSIINSLLSLKPIILLRPLLWCWFLILCVHLLTTKTWCCKKSCASEPLCVFIWLCLGLSAWATLSLKRHCWRLRVKKWPHQYWMLWWININAEGYQIFVSQWMRSWKYPTGSTSLLCTFWTEIDTQYLRVPPILRGNQRCCLWQMTGRTKKHNLRR